MGAAVIQSGEYKLEIDTGFDSGSFVLDSDLKGVLAVSYTHLTLPTNREV